MKLSHLPLRAITGAYILNSGLTKLQGGQETAEGVHGFATSAYPEFKRMPPEQFAKMLATAEIALGAALIMPIVPATLVGAGLTAFSAGLLGLYMRVPGLRQQGSLKPTQEGQGIAKDSWLLGIGLSLMLDRDCDRNRERESD